MVIAALADLSTAFDALYSPFGWEMIPPVRLLRALLLQEPQPLAGGRRRLACVASAPHFSSIGSTLEAEPSLPRPKTWAAHLRY
jgi:hypothetical protein